MNQVLQTIKNHEMHGPRTSNFEQMIRINSMIDVPDSSIFTILLYLKQNVMCETHLGLEPIRTRPTDAIVNNTIEWQSSQEVPYNIVLTDMYKVSKWKSVCELYNIKYLVPDKLRNCKSNVKLIQKEIKQLKPEIVIFDYSMINLVQNVLEQIQTVTVDINVEETQYQQFIQYMCDTTRSQSDMEQMDQFLTDNIYLKQCLLKYQRPYFVKKHTTVSGFIPQRIIYDGSDSRVRYPLHSKCTFLIDNYLHPIGTYIRSLQFQHIFIINLESQLKQSYQFITQERIYDNELVIQNIYQYFIYNRMYIITQQQDLLRLLQYMTNERLYQQVQNKLNDPCTICMNDYNIPQIHSQVIFCCCSAHCCDKCFEELVQPQGRYSDVIKCYMCRQVTKRNLILNVKNQQLLPPGFINLNQQIEQLNPQQVYNIYGIETIAQLIICKPQNVRTVINIEKRHHSNSKHKYIKNISFLISMLQLNDVYIVFK